MASKRRASTSPSRKHRPEFRDPTAIRGAFPRIRAWLDSRDLITGTPGHEKHRQLMLRLERLATNIYLGQPERVVFGLADLVILATAWADQIGLPIEDCISHRLRTIRYRDGEIVDGRWKPHEMTPGKQENKP